MYIVHVWLSLLKPTKKEVTKSSLGSRWRSGQGCSPYPRSQALSSWQGHVELAPGSRSGSHARYVPRVGDLFIHEDWAWHILHGTQSRARGHPPLEKCLGVWLTYWMLESRPWVMMPVNLVILLVSTSIHCL